MSTTTKNAGRRPLTPTEKKSIIITAICLAMAIILAVSLPILIRNSTKTPEPEKKPDSSSSSLYIKNGHFAFADDESTTFPKLAENWKIYTYKEPDEASNAHPLSEVNLGEENAKVFAGIVDVEDWDTVLAQVDSSLASISNPELAKETDTDTNVFMLATKEATNAGIASNLFSIASQASAKITINVNTSQLKDGSKAYVMIQKYASPISAKATELFAHTYEIEKADGWQEIELYVFNREASSTNVVCSVGIGNIYDNTDAEGVLFIDDIDYTTVSANEYRKAKDDGIENSRYHIIGEDKIRDGEDYATLVNYDGSAATVFDATSYITLDDAIVEGEAYSPFTSQETLKIYRVNNDGTNANTVALKLDAWKNAPIIVKSDDNSAEDHLHISFWVRVSQANVLAKCNILVQQLKLDADGNPIYDNGQLVFDKALDNASFKSVVTNQDIVEDSNCGWTKYDVYLKPTSAAPTAVRIVFALGNENGYAQAPYTPNGTLYVTSPYIENITASKYDGVSAGTYCKKMNLVGSTSTSFVSNGSFSNITSSNPTEPSDWKPAFGGHNIIFRDGDITKVPATLPTKISDVNAGVVRNAGSAAPLFDDSEANFLRIENKVATSFGYLSNDIDLSAKTVYLFSVLAKTTGDVNPFIYIVKNKADSREEAILAKIENKATTAVADDSKFAMLNFKEEESAWTPDGWTRYYLIVVTGDKSETVRLALFNGSIDGNTRQQGVVCYDFVTKTTLGTYTINTTEYEEGDEEAPATNRDRIDFAASKGYTAFDKFDASELTAMADKSVNSNVALSQPSEDDWNAMVEKALEKTETPEENTPADHTHVDWTLLTSVISSVALVGALLIVVVIRIFKRRSKQ